MRINNSRTIGRNLTRIESSTNGLIFVKEIAGPEEDAERRYQNCLRFDKFQSDNYVRRMSPELLHYEDEDRLLVYSYVSDAILLQELLADWRASGWQARHEFIDVLEEVAVLIATLHAHPIEEADIIESALMTRQRELPRKFRWLTPEEYELASGGELECWRLFHQDDTLHSGIKDWTKSSLDSSCPVLVHGDTRPDQFLVTDDEVLLLDWEEFSVGLGVRDLAGIAGSLVFESLDMTFTTPLAGGLDVLTTHQHYITCGGDNLRAVGPVIARFIMVYSNACGHRVDPVTLSRHMGAYLLERVIGRSMLSARLSASDKAIAGVARNAICRPDLMAGLISEAALEHE